MREVTERYSQAVKRDCSGNCRTTPERFRVRGREAGWSRSRSLRLRLACRLEPVDWSGSGGVCDRDVAFNGSGQVLWTLVKEDKSCRAGEGEADWVRRREIESQYVVREKTR